MNEIWRNIDNYPNYQISNLGRVKSLGNSKTRKEKILKPGTNKYGYLYVALSKDGKIKNHKVHRLVASAFIPNSNNYNEVNHKDEDKTNNRVENLEWCDRAYNINYGSRNERISKPIYSVNIVTNEIKYYQSAIDAGRLTNINRGNICTCLNGKLKSAGGYKWYYAS